MNYKYEVERGGMEKFLIVRRRKKESPPINAQTLTENPPLCETDKSVEMFSHDASTVLRNREDAIDISDEFQTNLSLSFALTPEQTEFVRSRAEFESLRVNPLGDIKLDVEQVDGGRFVFHFHVENNSEIRMLKADEVCQMLEVSKSFLMKLVRQKQIRSYKMSRLRRFSPEDIREYLVRSEEST